MKTKKIFMLLGIALLIFALGNVSAETIVSIQPPTQECPAEGETLSISVNIENAEAPGVAGAQLDILYDSESLEYVDASEGDFLTGGVNFNKPTDPDKEGRLKDANIQKTGEGGDTESGVLFSINFRVLVVKSSTLELDNVIISDPQAGSIPVTIEDAVITAGGNQPPVAVLKVGTDVEDISYDSIDDAYVGYPVYFDGEAFSSDSDGTIVKYELDFDGDGEYDWESAHVGTNSYVYDTAGEYTPKLRVTDNGGATDTDPATVIVEEGTAPAPAFSASPTSGNAPLTVEFTDLSTGNPTSWDWDFGDGDTSKEQNSSNTYQNSGTEPITYTVSLTATNDHGSDTAEDYITVYPESNIQIEIDPIDPTPTPILDVTLTNAEYAWYNLDDEPINYTLCSPSGNPGGDVECEPEGTVENIQVRLAGEYQDDPWISGDPVGRDYTKLLLHFNEDIGSNEIYDSSGHITSAISLSGPELVSGELEFGNALEFDSTTEKVEIPEIGNLDISDEITIEAWIRIDEKGTGSGITKDYAYKLIAADYSDMMILWGGLHIDGSWVFTKSVEQVELPLGEWKHVAMSYDGNKIRPYIDGAYKSEATIDCTVEDKLDCGANIDTSNNKLVLGKFIGIMDAVRILDKALNSREIRRDYGLSPGNHKVTVYARNGDDSAEQMVSFEVSGGGDEPVISIVSTSPGEGDYTESPVDFTIKLENTEKKPKTCEIELKVYEGTHSTYNPENPQITETIGCSDIELGTHEFNTAEPLSLSSGSHVYVANVTYDGTSDETEVEFTVIGEEPDIRIANTAPKQGAQLDGATPAEFGINLTNTGTTSPAECTIELNVWKGTNEGGISDELPNTIDCVNENLKDGATIQFTKSISLDPGQDYVYYLTVDYTGGTTGWYPSADYGVEFSTTGEAPSLSIANTAPAQGASVDGATPVEFGINLTNTGTTSPSECTIELNLWKGTNEGGISDMDQHLISCVNENLKDGATVQFNKSIALSPGQDYVYYLTVDYTGGTTGWYPSADYGVEFSTTGEAPKISIANTAPRQGAQVDGATPAEFKINLTNTGTTSPAECTITLNVWKGTNAGGISDKLPNTISCVDETLKDGNTVEFTKSITLSPGQDYVYYLKVDYTGGTTAWYPSASYGVEFSTTGEAPSLSIANTAPAQGAQVDGSTAVNFSINLTNTGTTSPSECTIELNVWKGTNAGGISDKSFHTISCVNENLKGGATVQFNESITLSTGQDYVYYLRVKEYTAWYPSASYGVEFSTTGEAPSLSIANTAPKQGAQVDGATPVDFKINLTNTGTTSPAECTITLNVWKGTNAGGISDKKPNTISCVNGNLKDGNTVQFNKSIALSPGTDYVYYLNVDYTGGSTAWYPSASYGVEFSTTGEAPSISIVNTAPAQGAQVDGATPVEFKINLTNTGTTSPAECTITLNVWKGTNEGGISDMEQHLISCVNGNLKGGATVQFNESIALSPSTDYVYYLIVAYTGGDTGWYPSTDYGVEFITTD